MPPLPSGAANTSASIRCRSAGPSRWPPGSGPAPWSCCRRGPCGGRRRSAASFRPCCFRASDRRGIPRRPCRMREAMSARPAEAPLPLVVEPMSPEDWPAVRAIYEAGIATGNATFETKAPAWEDWDRAHLQGPRLVARDAGATVLGWAAVVPVSGRCVYAGVGDLSVYVAPEARGRKVGRALLEALIRASEAAGL